MQDFRETVLLGRAVGSPCQRAATMLLVPLVPGALYCVSDDGIHLFQQPVTITGKGIRKWKMLFGRER